jgi:DNA-directed RNA polymerase beta subunit
MSSGKLTVDDLEKILDVIFNAPEKLIENQIKSYNFFIEKRMPEIVLEKVGKFEAKVADVKIYFRDIKLEKPRLFNGKPMYPLYARLNDITYAGDIKLKIDVVAEGKEHTEEIVLGKFPVMVKSNACWLSELSRDEIIRAGEDPEDPGGYFIINGSQRALIHAIDIGDNRIICKVEGKEDKREYVAEVFSQGYTFKSPILPINELSPRGKASVRLKSNGIFVVEFPRIIAPVPLIPLVRLLGISSDKEIFDELDIGVADSSLIVLKNIEKYSFETEEELYKEIGKYIIKFRTIEDIRSRVNTIIDRFLLPHVGTTPDARLEKAKMLLFMARKTLELKYGIREPDDKDHLMNKKVKSIAKLLEMIFEDAFRQVMVDLDNQLTNYLRRHGTVEKVKIKSVLRNYIFTNAIQSRFALGMWPDGATGVSQFMHIYNRSIILSYLRRVKAAHLSRKLPQFEVRDLHGTHFGRLDPAATPESQNLGLVLQLSLLASISEGLTPEEDRKIVEILRKLGVKQ